MGFYVVCFEELSVCLVLEEYDCGFFDCGGVESSHDFALGSGVCEGGAESGDVCDVGGVGYPAGDSAVDVGFCVESEDDVWFCLFEDFDYAED